MSDRQIGVRRIAGSPSDVWQVLIGPVVVGTFTDRAVAGDMVSSLHACWPVQAADWGCTYCHTVNGGSDLHCTYCGRRDAGK